MNMYQFTLNNKAYNSEKGHLTGEEILQITGLTPSGDFELFLKIAQKELEPIQLSETVDLTQPGLEHLSVSRRHKISYHIDDEEYTTYECLVTPLQLLQSGGFEASQFYLKQIAGHNEINYKNDENHEISLRPNMKFITCKRSPTTVSYIGKVGIECMEDQLQQLGYETSRPNSDMIAFNFEVPHGRFKGTLIEIALHAPQFPHVAPTGPYIKPHILPVGQGGAHPLGGIHNKNKPDSQWQYWSRPINDWDRTDKSMKTYLSFIRTLFDFQ